MATPISRNIKASGGFSLVESAIVLAIVGLIIGGIWVAAAAVNRERALNRTVEIIGVMNENYKAAPRLPPTTVYILYHPTCISDSTYTCLPRAYSPQIAPADAIASDGTIKFPIETTWIGPWIGWPQQALNFDIGGVSIKDCISLMTRLSSRFRGKISLNVEEASTEIAQIGVRPTDALANATTACNEPGYDTVGLFINFPP